MVKTLITNKVTAIFTITLGKPIAYAMHALPTAVSRINPTQTEKTMTQIKNKVVVALKFIVVVSLLLSSYPFFISEPYSPTDFAILSGILIVSFSMFYGAYILILKVFYPEKI
jgi:hypothetical protein